jgi:hypothetical protein
MAIPKLTIDILSEDRCANSNPGAFQRGLELFEQDNVLLPKLAQVVCAP